MAEPTGALPTNQAGSLLTNAAALAQLLGGTKTTSTTNPGDTAALQAALGQLQGADYQAMLQSIFQQAAGQIPGIQAALGNAVGARSGGNSAVSAALQKLLQQTTIGAQDQIAKQQLANLQTQVQAGQAVAGATKGTQTTEQKGTNIGQGVGTAAKLTAGAAALQSLLKLTGQGTVQDAIKSLTGGSTAAPAGATGIQGTTAAMQGGFGDTAAAPITSAPAPEADMAAPQAEAPLSPAVIAALQQLGIGSNGVNYQDVANSMGEGTFAFEPTAPIAADNTPSDMVFTADPNAYEFGTNWWE